MDDRLDTLDTMLDATGRLLADLAPRDLTRPTPCPDMDVDALVDHLTVWVQMFAASAHDRPQPFDPSTRREDGDRAATFAAAGADLVDGLRTNGFERLMTLTSTPLPGAFILNMVLMEYVGHGWDLARATGRPVPHDEEQGSVALDAARAIVTPEHRGAMFGPEVEVPADAPAVERLAAFLGRDPQWSPPDPA